MACSKNGEDMISFKNRRRRLEDDNRTDLTKTYIKIKIWINLAQYSITGEPFRTGF